MTKIAIIMRSYNDAWVIGETLDALFQQEIKDFELINVDSGSTDGTLNIIKNFNPFPIQIPSSSYKPGPVLNDAIIRSKGEILVFLNSDATPMNEKWLGNLIAPFAVPNTVATFGAQIPRANARPIVRLDYDRAFGCNSLAACSGSGRALFFSLGNSAICRAIWEKHHFSETLQYSEDIEWSNWAKEQGYEIQYVSEAKVMHSHNYSLRQTWKRYSGEGQAEALIFRWTGWRTSFIRYSLIPLLASVWRDTRYCLKNCEIRGLCEAPLYRVVEKFARYWGFRKGKRACPTL